MVRKIACAAVALVLCVGIMLAEEYKGKVEKVDAEKGTVAVKETGKEKAKTFKTDKDTKFVGKDDKALADGIKAVKEGAEVTVTYEKGDKEKKIPTKVKTIKVDK